MPELQEVRESEQLEKVHKKHRSSKANVIFVAFKTRSNKEYGKNNTTYALPPIMFYVYAHIYAETHIYMHAWMLYSYNMPPYILGKIGQ